MKHAAIRRELVEALVERCAPDRVTDEEPDVVAAITIVVAWTGSTRSKTEWVHTFEERIILPTDGVAAAHFPRRDELVRIVAMAVDEWDPGPTFTAQRPSLALGVVEVGKTPTKAVICRHTVSEPPELYQQ